MTSARDMRARFVEHESRHLFCVEYLTRGEPRHRVLLLPPFAEELNKSRRLLALTARALCDAQCDVLLPDLTGTGDSSGEFGEATWDLWSSDVRFFTGWLSDPARAAPGTVMALRSGALLTPACLQSGVKHIVLLQPVLDGRLHLQQFFRLRVMAEKFAGRTESVAMLEKTVQGGDAVEVAGYTVSSALASGLSAARLTAERLRGAERVDILECRPNGGEPGKAAANLLAGLTEQGVAGAAHVIESDRFWATQEIVAPTVVVESVLASVLGDARDG